MKTKLYSLLTGLLMATCITSHGQEIVSEFTFRNGNLFSDTDIMECSDGTLLTSITQYDNNFDAIGLLICKTTTDGQLLDSIQLDYGWSLWAINSEADNFVIPSYLMDETNSMLSFRMTFIDADLNVTNEILVPILDGTDYNSDSWVTEDIILDPLDNFIIT